METVEEKTRRLLDEISQKLIEIRRKTDPVLKRALAQMFQKDIAALYAPKT